MVQLESQVTVHGLSGSEITDFLLDPTDYRYREWWPGTHRQFHLLRRGPGGDHRGDVVMMDEFVGHRRVRMAAEVIDVVPGEKVVWQMRIWRLRLPVRLRLGLATAQHSVIVRHTITAGWSGRGRLLDPVWRLYFSASFAQAMDGHVRTEFPLLRDLLHRPHRQGTSEPEAAVTSAGRSVGGQLP